MRNNKQDLITHIKMSVYFLNYTDEDLKELYGKDLCHIIKMSYDEIKLIHRDLAKKVREKL